MNKRLFIRFLANSKKVRKHSQFVRYFVFILLIVLPLIVVQLFAQVVNTQKTHYIVGVARGLAPYSFLDENDEAVGYSVDITLAIAKVMQMDIEVIIAPFGELREALNNGEIDAMPMYYSENRKKKVDFTPPFSTVHNAIFIRKDSPAIETEEELHGKNIIVINGDIMHDWVLENDITNKLNIVSVESEALQLLASGEHDCALMAQLPGLYWVEELELLNIKTVGPLMIPSEICYAVTKDNTKLLNLLSEGLATLGENGEHKRIHDKWLGILIPIGVSSSTVLKYIIFTVVPLLLLLIIVFVWSRIFKQQVIKRTRELKESDSRFKSIFFNAPIAIEYYDSEGNLIDVNQECLNLFGVDDKEEIKGFKLFKDPNLSEDAIKHVREGKPYQYETEFDFDLVKQNKLYKTSKSGKCFMKIMITPYEISGLNKRGYLVHIEDISKRKQTEEKIIHLNLVLRAIRNVNQLIITEKNRDMLIQKVCEILIKDRGYNNAWIVLLSKQREYITSAEAGLGKSFIPMRKMLKERKLTSCGYNALKEKDIIIIENPKKECLDCPLSANYSGHSSYTICLRHNDNIYGLLTVSALKHYVNNKEEQDLFKEVAGDIAFALHSIEMEEERKQAVEELKAKSEFLESLIQQSPLPTFVLDSKGFVLMVNEAFLKFYAVPNKDLILGTNALTEPANIKQGVVKYFKEALKGKIVEMPEIEFVSPYENKKQFTRCRMFPILDTTGTLTNVVVMQENITEQKEAEAKLKKYHDHLEELVKERTAKLEKSQKSLTLLLEDVNESRGKLDISNKKLEASNKELEAFSYSVSHDLRAPLRHIDGFTKLLNKNIKNKIDEKSQNYFDNIIDSSQQMNKLIDDLLIFSRISRKDMKKTRFNMKTAIDEALQIFDSDIKENKISISVDDMPEVIVDASLIRQVWGNLISNAIKFTGKNENPAIHIGSDKDADGNNIFFIKDNGVGFDQKYVDKIFDVFQRLHNINEFPGTGIGLANVKRIIVKHGGHIRAEGKINEGASFFFSLPDV